MPKETNRRRRHRTASPEKEGQRPDKTVYRGHTIEVDAGRERALTKEDASVRLRIDGNEIPVERAEDGFLSHASMFKVYGSPYELAEDLIRQWGEAEISVSEPHSGHGSHPSHKPDRNHGEK